MEKKIVPTLLIVVLCVMVFSTYAWFAGETSQSAIQNIETGFPAQMSMSGEGINEENNQFTVESLKKETYKGQAGFRLELEAGTGRYKYVPYTENFADYRYILEADVEYKATSNKDSKFTLTLARVVAHVEYNGNKTWDGANGIAQDLGIKIEENITYLSTDLNTKPNSTVYYVNSTTEPTKIEYIVFLGKYAERFFEFDYYDNYNGVISDTKKDVGIDLPYDTRISTSGTTNAVRIKLGFYGLGVEYTDQDPQVDPEKYCRPFAFAGLEYQGTSFEFYFTAEVNNV